MTVPWLAAPATPTWPTTRTDVPDTGCVLGLPDGWTPDDPPLGSDGDPQGRTYRGTTPVDWLAVRHRVDPGAEGQLTSWVDVTLRAIGFPVIPPAELAFDLPRLLEWTEPGGDWDEDVRSRLGLDELHCYTGLATWQSHRLHLYLLLARRGDEAWHLTLSMETAMAPGLSAEIAAADDERAAAVFGSLGLG